mmetsp:Transcript_7216/g.13280  ORF Transcript_7216/g.13280 Transcript_7216/m.13280 type:complete len:98 (+) Transcript_7216:124-417(+)
MADTDAPPPVTDDVPSKEDPVSGDVSAEPEGHAEPAPAPVTDDAAPPAEDDAPPPEIKAFVGGLAWEVRDEDLQDEFTKFGAISARVATHRDTGRSR